MARILVIDDEGLVRAAYRLALERAGHEVIEAENGARGVEQLAETGADVVITDLVMPDEDGFQTIERIRRTFPDVPIIAVTGGGSAGPDRLLKLARAQGADFVLPKPVGKNDLLETVLSAVAK